MTGIRRDRKREKDETGDDRGENRQGATGMNIKTKNRGDTRIMITKTGSGRGRQGKEERQVQGRDRGRERQGSNISKEHKLTG